MAAAVHSHRQRRSLRHQDLGAALEAVGLVGATGCFAAADRTGQPQQNGRHERMHRTLKDEATVHPRVRCLRSSGIRSVSREFNDERPHEALDQRTPAWLISLHPPDAEQAAALEYPDRFEVRYVSANGGIRWNKDWVNVSTTCIGEYVGLEEIDDGIWNVYFGPCDSVGCRNDL